MQSTVKYEGKDLEQLDLRLRAVFLAGCLPLVSCIRSWQHCVLVLPHLNKDCMQSYINNVQNKTLITIRK